MNLPGNLGPSSEYSDRIRKYKQQLLEEEARILYVAVTRAKNAVVFSSSGKRTPSSPKYWSWKDEVMPVFETMPSELRWGPH